MTSVTYIYIYITQRSCCPRPCFCFGTDRAPAVVSHLMVSMDVDNVSTTENDAIASEPNAKVRRLQDEVAVLEREVAWLNEHVHVMPGDLHAHAADHSFCANLRAPPWHVPDSLEWHHCELLKNVILTAADLGITRARFAVIVEKHTDPLGQVVPPLGHAMPVMSWMERFASKVDLQSAARQDMAKTPYSCHVQVHDGRLYDLPGYELRVLELKCLVYHKVALPMSFNTHLCSANNVASGQGPRYIGVHKTWHKHFDACINFVGAANVSTVVGFMGARPRNFDEYVDKIDGILTNLDFQYNWTCVIRRP